MSNLYYATIIDIAFLFAFIYTYEIAFVTIAHFLNKKIFNNNLHTQQVPLDHLITVRNMHEDVHYDLHTNSYRDLTLVARFNCSLTRAVCESQS